MSTYAEKILLVDDNTLLLSSTKRFFERDFQHVLAVTNGEDAIAHVQKQFFHVVVLDVNLPGIDGWHVLENIRRNSPHSQVVVISSEDGEMRETAFGNGAFEFIEKPFDLGELKSIVMRIHALFESRKRVAKTFKVRFDDKYSGLTHNLSATGMLVVTSIPVECGTTLELFLHISDDKYMPLKGRVVRMTDSTCTPELSVQQWESPVEEVKYGLGIQLLEHPPEYPSFFNSLLT